MAKKQVAVSLRKPPSPEKLDAFVSAAVPEGNQAAPEGVARTSEIREIKPPPEPAIAMKEPAVAAPEPPPLVGADGRPMRAVTVYLPHPLAERLALHCIDLDRDMSNVVGEAVEQHLQPRLGPGVAATGAEGGARAEGAAPGSARAGASPFAGEWFGGAEFFAGNARVERFIQMGRVLVALWRQRPWAA